MCHIDKTAICDFICPSAQTSQEGRAKVPLFELLLMTSSIEHKYKFFLHTYYNKYGTKHTAIIFGTIYAVDATQ